MSRSSGPWICIFLVAVAFILASTMLPPPDPNNPNPTRSPFARGGRGGGRFSTYGGNGTQSQQQQRSPFPMGRGAGRGMFPFFQPQPPPRQQQPPAGQTGQSNVEERLVDGGDQQQQQQQPQQSPEQLQPLPQQVGTGDGVAGAQSSSSGESVEEEVVKEIPTVLLACLYGGIGASLLLLLCCRLYSWCCPPGTPYSPIADYYPPASTSPLISPLSLYQYKPAVSSTATTASATSHRFTPPSSTGNGHATSPLSVSLPNERSYSSLKEMEREPGKEGRRGWDVRDEEREQLVWAYSV